MDMNGLNTASMLFGRAGKRPTTAFMHDASYKAFLRQHIQDLPPDWEERPDYRPENARIMGLRVEIVPDTEAEGVR